MCGWYRFYLLLCVQFSCFDSTDLLPLNRLVSHGMLASKQNPDQRDTKKSKDTLDDLMLQTFWCFSFLKIWRVVSSFICVINQKTQILGREHIHSCFVGRRTNHATCGDNVEVPNNQITTLKPYLTIILVPKAKTSLIFRDYYWSLSLFSKKWSATLFEHW